MLQRQALGQTAFLGELYDARTDTFTSRSLLSLTHPPPSAITKTDNHSTIVKYNRHDSYKEKFGHFDMDPQLRASFLAGIIDVEGSGLYLKSKRESNLEVQQSMWFNITTANENINFQAKELEQYLLLSNLNTDEATHVVSEINWGSRNIFTIKQSLSRSDVVSLAAGRLDAEIAFFKSVKFSTDCSVTSANEDHKFDNSFKVSLHGDVVAPDGLVPTDLASAWTFIKCLHKYVANANDGKGRQLSYKLLPLPTLAKDLQVQLTREITIRELNKDCFDQFIQEFDQITRVFRTLNDYLSLLCDHRGYISKGHIDDVTARIDQVSHLEESLKTQYKKALKDVRAGTAHESALSKVLDDFRNGKTSIHELADIDPRPINEKIRLLTSMVAKGAKYIGFNGESIDFELGSTTDTDIYVLSFSDIARRNSESWKQNISLLYRLFRDMSPHVRVILKDCDALGEVLDTPRITLHRNAQVITEDVLEHRKISASKCTARYEGAHLEVSGAPNSRIVVKIPCPGIDCKTTSAHNWICSNCNGQIEYGHIDQYIYCACGRCEYKNWAFRCSSPQHGPEFSKFDDVRLLELLKEMEPFAELNILILGRTGAGKSTWINAFVNYVRFLSLDDALGNEELHWNIPFSFMDGQEKVSAGFDVGLVDSRMDELDGSSGNSATQRTIVHRIKIGSRLIRLIDTPGIGDTRGFSHEKQNMADILGVLQSYPKLHGILILLESRSEKCDIAFKFYFQELFSHLHRDAARNIAFGFTKARGSDYEADNKHILNRFLAGFKGVDVGVRDHNGFIFDSEGFNYLAAMKLCNKSVHKKKDMSGSWKISAAASKKLLEYFGTLKPYHVNSTVNLYETRHRLGRLMDPLVAIGERIKSSKDLLKVELEELSRANLTMEDVMKHRKIRLNTVSAIALDKPRTTCVHSDCVERLLTGAIGHDCKQEMMTIYSKNCHDPCYLTDVIVDNVGDSGLLSCWAMNGTQDCRVCSYSWTVHKHVTYTSEPKTKEIDDPKFEEKLKEKAPAIDRAEVALSTRREYIGQLETEQNKFQDVAAQSTVFLKRNAIVAYNDAACDYLELNINVEKRKVLEGGSKDLLERLEQLHKQHTQLVALFEQLEQGKEDKLQQRASIEDLVQELFALPIYGEDLREMEEVIEAAQAPIFHEREKPPVVRAEPHFGGEEIAGHGHGGTKHHLFESPRRWLARLSWVLKATGFV